MRIKEICEKISAIQRAGCYGITEWYLAMRAICDFARVEHDDAIRRTIEAERKKARKGARK